MKAKSKGKSEGAVRTLSRESFGLSARDARTLRALKTPARIQKFIDELPYDYADTARSPQRALRERRGHCLEGALLAAAALRLQGHRPLLMDLEAVRDDDHVIALYRERGLWGGVAKSNYAGLRFRAPVYRTLRELAMSYFHEYTNRRHQKTLREYSVPFDLRRIDPGVWVTGRKNAWEVAEHLDALRHFKLVNGRQEKALLRRDPFEQRVGGLLQYRRPKGD